MRRLRHIFKIINISLFVIIQNVSGGYESEVISDDALLRMSRVASRMDEQLLQEVLMQQRELQSPEKEIAQLVLNLRELAFYDADILINEQYQIGNKTCKDLERPIDFWAFKSGMDGLINDHIYINNLKKIFHRNLIKEEIWYKLDYICAQKDKQPTHYPETEFIPYWFHEESFIEELALATAKIDSFNEIEDGDTLVGVGNTPQFILEHHRTNGKKKLKYLQLAISGAPGKIKKSYLRWHQSIITEQGLKNYRSYLTKLGLLGDSIQGKIFFMDIIGSGGGPSFVINECLRHSNIFNKDKLCVLGINSKDSWQDNAIIPGICTLSLEMNILAQKLDRVPDGSSALRVMPHFPAIGWEEPFDPPKIPYGAEARKLIEKIRSSKIEPITASILDQRDHDNLNPVELAVFQGRVNYAKIVLLTINPSFEQVQSILNRLIISEDNLPFCQWLISTFNATPKQVEITEFDKKYTSKEANLKKLI